jgi:predicted ribosomally synthesized peptide with nif11-like leader
MSLKNVELFYERLLADKVFRQKIKSADSKEECSHIVKAAGYDFTQKELEEYTAKSIKGNASEHEIQSLKKRELETVAGGMLKFIIPPQLGQEYGTVPPPIENMF